MAINEIFLNPTVIQVSFEIRYPNLFFIEDKVGDLQIRVMEQFPESALVLRKQVVFADVGPDGKVISPPRDLNDEIVKKIWQFKSEKDYEFNVLSNSLYIISKHHITYKQEGADKFRDVIEFVVNNFLEVTKITKINRIGLRYIDECPIPEKTNEKFKEYYNTAFPLDRFNIADAEEMTFRTAVRKGDYFIGYLETLKKEDKGYKLILDFDGFANKIEAKDYLTTTDNLHEFISDEYENSIKDPVREFMRQASKE